MANKFSIHEHVDGTFKEHVCVPSPSQSYSFFGHTKELKYVPQLTRESLKLSRSSAYSFEITWRPGHIILTGDLGELTLVQKNAMPTFKDALEWVVEGDYDYLMGKSNVKKAYDAEATYNYLIDLANREATEQLLGNPTWSSKESRYIRRDGIISHMRRYKDECKEAVAEFGAALAAYAVGEQDGEPPKLEDFLPYEEDFGPILRTRSWIDVARTLTRADRSDVKAIIRRTWEICGYETWVSFWCALEATDRYDPEANIDDPDQHPTFVLKPSNRRALKQQIRDLCYQQHELVEFLHNLGFDDFYGSYTYPHSSKWQIDAIKHGCKMLLARLQTDIDKSVDARTAA